MTSSALGRRRDALRAATEVASRLGIEGSRPEILKDSNNTIVHLVPAPLVAKVGTSHFRPVALESLERELSVAQHLASKGAPVVRPASGVPPGPHRFGDLVITLWDFHPQTAPDPSVDAARAVALSVVHQRLLDYPLHLPPFTVELEDAERLLSERRLLVALAEKDREFLLDVHQEISSALAGVALEYRPLHGSPHSGNWLNATGGPLLLDFETACRGPVEWDLSAIGAEAASAFPDVDHNVLALLQRMRSLCVATKCCAEPDRAPEVQEAAQVHLRLLRGET